jgi:hypothetical protein
MINTKINIKQTNKPSSRDPFYQMDQMKLLHMRARVV